MNLTLRVPAGLSFSNEAKALTTMALLGVVLSSLGCGEPVVVDHSGPTAQWAAYGANGAGTRHSPLTQITKDNVTALEIAWVYNTGDVDDGSETALGTAFQNTPILVDDTLYVCSPRNKVIALDPNTGEERWVFDAKIDTEGMYIVTCRPATG